MYFIPYMWMYIGLMVSAFGSNKAFREIKKISGHVHVFILFLFFSPSSFLYLSYNRSKA